LGYRGQVPLDFLLDAEAAADRRFDADLSREDLDVARAAGLMPSADQRRDPILDRITRHALSGTTLPPDAVLYPASA